MTSPNNCPRYGCQGVGGGDITKQLPQVWLSGCGGRRHRQATAPGMAVRVWGEVTSPNNCPRYDCQGVGGGDIAKQLPQVWLSGCGGRRHRQATAPGMAVRVWGEVTSPSNCPRYDCQGVGGGDIAKQLPQV